MKKILLWHPSGKECRQKLDEKSGDMRDER